jgi:hypothetical protein
MCFCKPLDGAHLSFDLFWNGFGPLSRSNTKLKLRVLECNYCRATFDMGACPTKINALEGLHIFLLLTEGVSILS